MIEAICNHVSGHLAGVAGIYNRAQYLAERRQALQLWSEHVVALASGRRSESRAAARSAPEAVKGALTDADAARLADIAGIPDENRKQFTDEVGRAIAAARRHHSITPRRKLPTPADQANKAALQFVRSLRAIPPDQPNPFAAVLPFGSAYPIEVAATKAKRGRPAAVFSTAFERFVGSLLLLTLSAGGRPSVDRKNHRGRLADMLDVLRPHLPPGFIPKRLPWSKLERLRVDAVAIVKTTTAKNRS